MEKALNNAEVDLLKGQWDVQTFDENGAPLYRQALLRGFRFRPYLNNALQVHKDSSGDYFLIPTGVISLPNSKKEVDGLYFFVIKERSVWSILVAVETVKELEAALKHSNRKSQLQVILPKFQKMLNVESLFTRNKSTP
ncbi:MAG: hypothetical protein KF693_12165 [Nitrospira sp.]|nr:hypothetical protein [Nitrospira sp.]